MSDEEHDNAESGGASNRTPKMPTPYRSLIADISTRKRPTGAPSPAASPYAPPPPAASSPASSPASPPASPPAAGTDGGDGGWLARYERGVLAHHSTLQQLESSALSAIFMVPGTWRDTSAECVYAGLKLLALLHDRLLLRFARAPPATRRARRGVALATALNAVQVTELLAELVSEQRAGGQYRWRVVALVETLKALLRLAMLVNSRGRMLTAQSVPARGAYPLDDVRLAARIAELDAGASASDSGSSSSSSSATASPERPTLATALRARTPPNKARSRTEPERASVARHCVAELIWILRPLAGLYASRRLGRRSWRAWLVPVLLELLSRVLHETDPARRLSPAETREIRRRTMLWALYGMRYPAFNVVAGVVQRVPVGPLRRIGFLRSIANVIGNYLATYPERHFYTSI